MAIYQWTNADGTGDFGDQYNWIDPTIAPPTYGVPGADDTAVIDATGTITGSGSVGELVANGDGGLLTLYQLQVTAQELVLAGTVSLIGITSSYADLVGDQEIIVTGGTTTAVAMSELDAGIGNAAPNAVGLDVGMDSGDIAALNLTTSTTQMQIYGENTVLGDSGTGSMTIGGGAYVALLNDDNLNGGELFLGNAVGGQGTLVVTGDNSRLDVSAETVVGQQGIGRLTIAAGAQVNLATGRFDTPIWVGQDSGSNGNVLVTGAGSRLMDAVTSFELVATSLIGGAGAGTLTVANGAAAAFGQLDVGEGDGGTGKVIVEGVGSLLQISADVYLGGGEETLGGGSGTLSVLAGALAIDETGEINGVFCVGGGDGAQHGVSGAVNVSGAGSTLNTGAHQLLVGWTGIGTMTVGAGGTVISAGYDGTPAAIIGDGNTGGVTIDGVGARWVATGEVEIGGSATGRLLVEAGGTLATGDGTYGFVAGAGAMGTVEVTGAGSRLTNSGSFMVGDDGPGTLGVLAGAVVSTTVPGGVAAQGAMIGAYASGRVTVSGTGSTWSIFGQLEIGFYATGNLAIGTDGKVTASALQLDSAGTLTLSGAGTALQISGNATFDESSAAGVSIGTGSLLSIAGTAAVNGQIAMAGGTLTVGKPLSLTYGGQIAGRGTVQAARLSNAGTIASSAGTLSFIGNISGTGQMQVGAASTLRLQGAVAAGSKAVFEAATGTLQLAAPAGFAGSIADFVKGDVIDLSGIVASSLTYSGQKLTVHESNGSTLGLLFSAAYTSASFAPPASDGHGGTLITHA